MLQGFLAEEIESFLCGVPSCSKTRLLFRNDLFSLWLDLQHDLARMVKAQTIE